MADGQDPGEFVDRYRRTARDLSIARARGYSQRLTRYLNELVVAGHNLVYAHHSGFVRSVVLFLKAGFPQDVRCAWRYMLTAGVLFFGSLLAMALTVLLAPEWIYTVMPAEQASQLEAMYDPNASHLGRERQSDSDFMMFGFYIMNNISITFQLFASGLVLGLGTLFYIAVNGVFIGAAAGHLLNVGYQSTFFQFVIGHGSFELTALVIAGGAGFMLGHALLAPGMVSRLDALRRAAPSAVRIVMGAALMDLAAAFIEAFWSSSSTIPAAVKYAVGAVLWASVLLYFCVAGRGVDARG